MSPGYVDASCISRAGLNAARIDIAIGRQEAGPSVDKKRNGLYWSWVRAEREIVTDRSPSTSNRVAHHATATEKEMDRAAYRLPTHVQPRHYTIALDARLDVQEFHGQVTVEVEVLEPERSVELHARGLQLADARLTAHGRTLAGEVTLHPEQEMAVI